MKSKQKPTQAQETPWQPLSPEQIASLEEWLESTKADLRPASRYPAIQQEGAAINPHPIGSFARLEFAQARRRKSAEPAIVCVSQEIVTPQRRGPIAGDTVPAMTDRRWETDEADMDSKRRYNSGVAAFCGLLGGIVLPVLIGRKLLLDDRWLNILCLVGLPGGWALGATYIYPLFYYKNGTPRSHTARIHAAIGSRGRRLCAKGRHDWNGLPSMCKRCGKPQFSGHYRAAETTRV